MGVGDVGIALHGQGDRVLLVGDVGDAERRFVRAEADLLADVFVVGATIRDALGIVRVPGASAPGVGVREAARERRIRGIADIDHVESAATCISASAAAHRVGETRLFVDHDVVDAVDAVVVGVLLEGDHRSREVAQPGQVKDLHAVIGGAVGDDEDVICVHLHVAPRAAGRRFGFGKVADHHGIHRIGHIDERDAVHAPHDCVVALSVRIGPPPDIVDADAAGAAQILDRHERHQVHIAATEHGSLALGAVHLAAQHRVVALDFRKYGVPVRPAVPVPLEDQGRAEAVVVARHAGNQHIATLGHDGAHPFADLAIGRHDLLDRRPAVRAVTGELVDHAPAAVSPRVPPTHSVRPSAASVDPKPSLLPPSNAVRRPASVHCPSCLVKETTWPRWSNGSPALTRMRSDVAWAAMPK